MAELTACCGLDCAGCEGYQATQADDDLERAKVAAQWSARYNVDIKPEQVNCDGCRTDGRKVFYCENMCEIRKCCNEKSLDNCAACGEYPCEKLEAFFKMAPEARTALEALRNDGSR